MKYVSGIHWKQWIFHNRFESLSLFVCTDVKFAWLLWQHFTKQTRMLLQFSQLWILTSKLFDRFYFTSKIFWRAAPTGTEMIGQTDTKCLEDEILKILSNDCLRLGCASKHIENWLTVMCRLWSAQHSLAKWVKIWPYHLQHDNVTTGTVSSNTKDFHSLWHHKSLVFSLKWNQWTVSNFQLHDLSGSILRTICSILTKFLPLQHRICANSTTKQVNVYITQMA